MATHKAELETWAKQHGIDVEYLFGGFGKKRPRHALEVTTSVVKK